MNIADLFQRGGPTMYVIAAASVIALTLFIERLWALRTSRVVPQRLILEVSELLRGGKIAEAIGRCAGSASTAGAVFAAVLKKAHEPVDVIKEVASDVGRREAQRLERGLEALGVIAALGPLLGLLGTVLGMIKVFQKVNELGAGSPVEMAAGIWEALLATAAGLMVGIPALVMHRFLISRVDGLVLRLEDEAVLLVDLVEETQQSAPPAAQ